MSKQVDPLSRQLEDIQRRFPGATSERQSDGSVLMTLPNFPLPPGWSRMTTTVRFVVPVGFPIANPDSFWADADLRLDAGGLPMNTALQAPWPGRGEHLWFSWHPSHWSPQRDSLVNYVGVIARRLGEAR